MTNNLYVRLVYPDDSHYVLAASPDEEIIRFALIKAEKIAADEENVTVEVVNDENKKLDPSLLN